MKVTYNTHIQRIKDVKLGTGELEKYIKALEILPTSLRLHGSDGKSDVKFSDFQGESMLQPLIKGDLQMVEILTRDPARRTDWSDKNDANQWHWNGVRGTGEVPRCHPLRGTPMFFRDNGAAIDMIDSFVGRSCFLILNGGSFDKVDKSLLRTPGIFTFGVNNGAHSFPTNFWTCVDDPKRFMPTVWENPTITKFVPTSHFHKATWDPYAGCPGPMVKTFPNVVGYRRNERFVPSQWMTEDTVNWGNHKDFGGGRSCMVAAFRIIHLLGFRRIFLLGCDFNMSDENRYWFDEKRTGGAVKNNNNSYRILIKYFTDLQPLFAKSGFSVYNCNPDSGLKVFDHMPLKDAVDSCRMDESLHTSGWYVDKDELRPRFDKGGDGPAITLQQPS